VSRRGELAAIGDLINSPMVDTHLHGDAGDHHRFTVASMVNRRAGRTFSDLACGTGSPRNFRRLVAAQKQAWRRDRHRGRRPTVWSPGEHLVIDWGTRPPHRVSQ
jgi:hypothetical protein